MWDARRHYDAHSTTVPSSTIDALARRAHGPSIALKKFHNAIKRRLISTFAHGAERLLDVACGRGGDIAKWMDADIAYVKAIDVSGGSIEEARNRYRQIAHEGRTYTRCDFEERSATVPLVDIPPFDVVTCMFALQYFFESEHTLRMFFHSISLNLKSGGFFIGTVPEAHRVMEEAARPSGDGLSRVSAAWAVPSDYGSRYVCAIEDTVTEATTATSGSEEFLVFPDVLVEMAARFRLVPVIAYGDPTLERMLDPADANSPLKHFKPSFADAQTGLHRASSMYAAFVFRKL